MALKELVSFSVPRISDSESMLPLYESLKHSSFTTITDLSLLHDFKNCISGNFMILDQPFSGYLRWGLTYDHSRSSVAFSKIYSVLYSQKRTNMYDFDNVPLTDYLPKFPYVILNPYPWIFGTITERVFWKKIQNHRWWRHIWDLGNKNYICRYSVSWAFLWC